MGVVKFKGFHSHNNGADYTTACTCTSTCTSQTDNMEDMRSSDMRANWFFFPARKQNPRLWVCFALLLHLLYIEQGCGSPHPTAARLLIQCTGNCPPPSFISRASGCQGKCTNKSVHLPVFAMENPVSLPGFCSTVPAAAAALLSAHAHPVSLKRGLPVSVLLRGAPGLHRNRQTDRQPASCLAKLAQKASCERVCALCG